MCVHLWIICRIKTTLPISNRSEWNFTHFLYACGKQTSSVLFDEITATRLIYVLQVNLHQRNKKANFNKFQECSKYDSHFEVVKIFLLSECFSKNVYLLWVHKVKTALCTMLSSSTVWLHHWSGVKISNFLAHPHFDACSKFIFIGKIGFIGFMLNNQVS